MHASPMRRLSLISPAVRLAVVLCGVFLLHAPAARACAVPVFRYALEHWPAMPCLFSVYHQGPLTPDQKALVEGLGQSNLFYVATCDLAAPTNNAAGLPFDMQDAWNKIPRRAPPPAVALSCWGGREYEPQAVMTLPLSRATVDTLAGKIPVHHEIARRLLAGDSAVWVLLDCPDAAKNEAARKMLTATLREMEQMIKLPSELDPNDTTYEEGVNTNIALKISFPILEIPGTGLEADLIRSAVRTITTNAVTTTDPVAIPVFGRGLALDALSGPVLDPEVVRSVCGFLCSPCSCSVKEMRLGVSLFIPIDWDAVITRAAPVSEVLPPLTVPGAVGTAASGATPGQPAAGGAAKPGVSLSRTLLALLGVAALIVVAGTFKVLRGQREDGCSTCHHHSDGADRCHGPEDHAGACPKKGETAGKPKA